MLMGGMPPFSKNHIGRHANEKKLPNKKLDRFVRLVPLGIKLASQNIEHLAKLGKSWSITKWRMIFMTLCIWQRKNSWIKESLGRGWVQQTHCRSSKGSLGSCSLLFLEEGDAHNRCDMGNLWKVLSITPINDANEIIDESYLGLIALKKGMTQPCLDPIPIEKL